MVVGGGGENWEVIGYEGDNAGGLNNWSAGGNDEKDTQVREEGGKYV
jgi:hypothetical protein